MGALFSFQLFSYAEAGDYSTHYKYDALNRLVKVIAPDGSSIRTLYNDNGQAWRLEKYDRNGQLFNIIENLFSITGQVVKSYGPECFRYPADLSLKPTYPEGSRETSLAKCGYSVIEYDDLDRPYLTTDAQGRKVKTLFRTKADNRQIIIKAYGTSLQQDYATYTYSPNGKVKTVMDANGNVKTSIILTVRLSWQRDTPLPRFSSKKPKPIIASQGSLIKLTVLNVLTIPAVALTSQTGAALSLPPSMTLLTALISSQMGKDASSKRSIIQMDRPIRSSKLTAHLYSRIMPPIATALMVKLRPSWTQMGM